MISTELCNVSASTFICSVVFKIKGLKKLRFASLKKECSAILDFFFSENLGTEKVGYENSVFLLAL